MLVVVALFATGVIGGGDDEPTPAPNTASSATPGSGSTSAPSDGRSRPTATKVAVLNGTTIPGLASREKDTLTDAGLQRDRDGQQHRPAARGLLRALRHPLGRPHAGPHRGRRLDIATVQRLDADTRDLSEDADVVVILGQDKAP